MVEENIPTSAGLSSFNLLDELRFFESVSLRTGMQVLDLGCGLGNYAIAAAPRVGPQGTIYAFDPWEEGLETLEVRAAMAGHDNIRPALWQAGKPLPLADQSIDLCLLATLIHILAREGQLEPTLQEVERVLGPGGIVAVVEFYKTEGPPGPPLDWRLGPVEVAAVFGAQGFKEAGSVRIGPHNYLSLFCRS